MAISGNGREYDITLIPEAVMRTTTSQYHCVGMVAGTTTVDRAVGICGATGTGGTPTSTAYHAIGINQSYLSSGSESCDIRMFGVSKATCAESITTGEFVMAYWGISTSAMRGKIVAVDNGVTCTVATASVTSHTVILGRALEAGSTNTVISVFVNPQLYDNQLVGSIGIT